MGIGNVVICRPAGGLNYSDVIYHYSPPAAEKSGGTIDHVTTDSPYNKARSSGASLYYYLFLR